MKRKAILLASPEMRAKVFGGGSLERLAGLVDLVDACDAMGDKATLRRMLADREIIISTWGMPRMDRGFLEAAPQLRAVFYAAGSVKGFVTDESYDRGVAVSSAWAANAVPVAEFTVAQLVLGLKNWFAQVQRSRDSRTFVRTPVHGCYKKRVGIIGCGMVGKTVIALLKPYELEIAVNDPYLPKEDIAALNATPASLEEVFATCHAVSLHAPNIPETRHMVREEHVLSMLPGACFINTSRGALVDEEGLARALAARPDVTVLLDVTDPEPPPAESPLWDMPNVFISPHIAGSLDDECWRMADYALGELERYVAGEALRYEVTREMLPKMA